VPCRTDFRFEHWEHAKCKKPSPVPRDSAKLLNRQKTSPHEFPQRDLVFLVVIDFFFRKEPVWHRASWVGLGLVALYLLNTYLLFLYGE
jgi:hypothetical protein